MEERVAAQRSGREPDRHGEDGAAARHRSHREPIGPRRTFDSCPAGHERQGKRDPGDETERQCQGSADDEGDHQRSEEDREAPGESRSDGRAEGHWRSETCNDEGARQQQNECSGHSEPERKADALGGQKPREP
jgi:hypothetical protein